MATRDLSRLEAVIGTILRAGVALSAVAMVVGLALTALGWPQAAAILNGGLLLLMMIPTARIVVSFIDALMRRDQLLAGATAVVIAVIAWQVWLKIFKF